MKRLNPVSVLLVLVTALSLSACETGGGYSGARPWETSADQAPAQAAPSALPGAMPAVPTQPVESSELPPPGTAQTPSEPALPPVKIALLLPLSGPHANLGDAMMKASQIALFDAGHANFEVLPLDSKGTAAGAAEAARKALAQDAKLILGPVFAEAVRAVKPIAAAANVNVIAFSTDWTLAGGNTYIMGFLPFDQIERVVSYAAGKGVSHIGVIAPETAYGRAVAGAYTGIAQRSGITTPASITLGTGDLSAALKKFARYEEQPQIPPGAAANIQAPPAPYDAVLMPLDGETALTVSGLLSNYNLPPSTVRRLGTGLFDDPALLGERALEGAWFAAPSPRLRDGFEKRFQSTYRAAPPRLATLAYDATALAAVLARHGQSAGGQPSFDRGSITNPNGFAGIDGIFRFRPDGTAERGLAVLEIGRGGVRVIDEAPRTFQQPPQQQAVSQPAMPAQQRGLPVRQQPVYQSTY